MQAQRFLNLNQQIRLVTNYHGKLPTPKTFPKSSFWGWQFWLVWGEMFILLSQWLTFWTFGDSIFSRENKVHFFFQGPLAKWVFFNLPIIVIMSSVSLDESYAIPFRQVRSGPIIFIKVGASWRFRSLLCKRAKRCKKCFFRTETKIREEEEETNQPTKCSSLQKETGSM